MFIIILFKSFYRMQALNLKGLRVPLQDLGDFVFFVVENEEFIVNIKLNILKNNFMRGVIHLKII